MLTFIRKGQFYWDGTAFNAGSPGNALKVSDIVNAFQVKALFGDDANLVTFHDLDTLNNEIRRVVLQWLQVRKDQPLVGALRAAFPEFVLSLQRLTDTYEEQEQ